LWELFKALIAGVLNEMASLTNVDKSDVLKKIEDTVVDFLRKSCKWIALPCDKKL
jgi:hypothetical protein